MAEEETQNVLSTFGSSRIDGYLYKLEQRPFVGQMRKKYWFVLPRDTPILYWYKFPTDFNCAGRILLSGAAFIYNPREQGIFEIHVDNKCYLLEAPNKRARLDWLSALQQSRRRYYRLETDDKGKTEKDEAAANDYQQRSADKDNEDENQRDVPTTSAAAAVTDEEPEDSARSVFYLSEDGGLHPGSLEVPPTIYTVCDAVELKIDALLSKGVEETQQLELATKKLLHKARNSLSHPIPSQHHPKENCAQCQELSESLEQLRNRCYELTDDLVVHQELVKCLKRGVVAAHNQRDALKRFCMDSSSDAEKVEFILERESALAKTQFAISELRRDIETLKEENRILESENCSLNITVEAYQESVRTKDELIMNMVSNANDAFRASNVPSATATGADTSSAMSSSSSSNVRGIPLPSTLRKSLMGSFIGRGMTSSPSSQSAAAIGDSNNSPSTEGVGGAEATEALLVDFGTPTDVAAKNLFTETAVNDLNEMKDLVDGYRNQNKFLNNELLELQKILQSLEDRERKLIRQNFNIEAVYYQLKSRYIMLLNHFQPSMDRQKRQPMEPSMIQELIDEVTRPHSPMRIHNSNSLAVETAKSSSTLATLVSYPRKAVAVLDAHNGGGVPHHSDPETDSLGFYLNSPRTRKAVAEFFAKAAAENGAENGEQTTKEEQKGEQKFDHQVKADDGTSTVDGVRMTESAAAPLPNDGSSTFYTQSNSNVAPLSSSVFASPSMVWERSAGDALKQDDWLLRLAADFQKRSDDIMASIGLGNNHELVEWLQRWDAYLVNHVLHPLSPNPQLKMLVRCGIPNTYRTRVWRSLVDFLVGPTKSETGKGYYDCLLLKAQRIQEQSAGGMVEEDAALKQIDLDLVRTLPNNKLFETEQSPKVASLKNILYAFRFHNRTVEYCQGLNRLGAIGLLYLDEPQAFWFLVACVDHLQPSNYYSPNLLGAVVDQRVLLDLVQDKMPALHSHLHKLEVDLSLFTLSWFLTIFVDVLSHNVYIKIYDVFLLEGNKVLFRFALALLKVAEQRLLECVSLSGVQNCLSNLSSLVTDFKTLSHVAFNCLNPFPARSIENRRQSYYANYKNGKFK